MKMSIVEYPEDDPVEQFYNYVSDKDEDSDVFEESDSATVPESGINNKTSCLLETQKNLICAPAHIMPNRCISSEEDKNSYGNVFEKPQTALQFDRYSSVNQEIYLKNCVGTPSFLQNVVNRSWVSGNDGHFLGMSENPRIVDSNFYPSVNIYAHLNSGVSSIETGINSCTIAGGDVNFSGITKNPEMIVDLSTFSINEDENSLKSGVLRSPTIQAVVKHHNQIEHDETSEKLAKKHYSETAETYPKVTERGGLEKHVKSPRKEAAGNYKYPDRDGDKFEKPNAPSKSERSINTRSKSPVMIKRTNNHNNARWHISDTSENLDVSESAEPHSTCNEHDNLKKNTESSSFNRSSKLNQKPYENNKSLNNNRGTGLCSSVWKNSSNDTNYESPSEAGSWDDEAAAVSLILIKKNKKIYKFFYFRSHNTKIINYWEIVNSSDFQNRL